MTVPGASAGIGVPRGRTRIFQDLMRHRVRHIVLVSSLYDSFILSEDGQINDALGRQFADLRLNENPDLIRVSSGAEALAMAKGETGVDMIITSIQPGDMDAVELARQVRAAGLHIPVVLLAYNHRELNDFLGRHPRGDLDRVYLWQGDARLLLAMVKDQEDRLNLERDTGRLGVPAILVVEDSVRYLSAFLPVIYAELMAHSQQLITEGLNLSQKLLRMRARPKIILSETFEEAWETFTRHENSILGIVSDFEFPRAGALDRGAGAELVARVRERRPDIPVVMQSSIPENEAVAAGMNAAFLLKGSPLLLHRLREVLLRQFGFGPFVFRLPDGSEIDEAQDLRSLADKLRTVPVESLVYHAERNHFSMWLKARTEYTLAERLRPRRISDYATLEDLRADLVRSITAYRVARDRAVVADFRRGGEDRSICMARIGAGSLGGKARGLAFVNRLLLEVDVAGRFPGVRIEVPPAVVLGTDVFDQVLEENGLYDFALGSTSEEEIGRRFAAARFPGGPLRDLRAFLRRVEVPLSVRSSGLLEDSPSQPLAGVYRTIMVSNRGALKRRLDDLVAAVKSVYASTFSAQAKAFVRTTPFRLEQEKMAVIIQHIVGTAHGIRFYPDISGVARSRNVYPAPPLKSEDGIAAVALGLGRAVVEGDACVQFSPRYPRHALVFSSIEAALNSTQREFYALDLSRKGGRAGPEGVELSRFGLREAEEDGTLAAVGSTYVAENQAVSDGIGRPGVRLVSFAPILKHNLFPLADILDSMLELGRYGTGSDVEIEFAANLSVPAGQPPEFGFLQMRPLVLAGATDGLEIGEIPDDAVLCRSDTVLGHGRIEDLCDIVVVDEKRFDRLRSVEVAEQVARFNATLQARGVPYLLIGVGRWGSMDRHLGIPVSWSQIAGARVIVESGFRDLRVTPSQGTHFFQNLTSLNVGYFTVNPQAGEGRLDWEWLAGRPAVEDTGFVRHVRLDGPLQVVMDGRGGRGLIRKPGW